MEAEKGTYPSGGLHNVRDNTEHTITVKVGLKIGADIDHAKNYISEHNAPEKKNYFPKKPISGVNRKFKSHKSQIIRKIKKNNESYRQTGLFCISVRRIIQPRTVRY